MISIPNCYGSYGFNETKANLKQKENNESIEKCIKEELISLNGVYSGYYQVANRIAYANFISKHYDLKVNLVFLGFINDTHFKDYFIDSNTFLNEMNVIINNVLCINQNKNQNLKITIKCVQVN